MCERCVYVCECVVCEGCVYKRVVCVRGLCGVFVCVSGV